MAERYQLKKDANNQFIGDNCPKLNKYSNDGRIAYVILKNSFDKSGGEYSRDWTAYNASNEVVLDECCLIYFSDLRLISVNDSMSNFNQLSAMQEANLSEDAKSLVKVGLLDANLVVRDVAKLTAMLVELNFKELAALAKEEIAKAEAESNKNKTI